MRGVVVLVGLAGFAAVGCAPPRSAETVTPMIAISPGVPGRLALMDRYRLHDEDRKHMMERPRVWVEEAPEADDEDAAEAPQVSVSDGAAPQPADSQSAK